MVSLIKNLFDYFYNKMNCSEKATKRRKSTISGNMPELKELFFIKVVGNSAHTLMLLNLVIV